MGYHAGCFPQRANQWIASGWVFPGCRLIEFGSQEFYGAPEPIRAGVREFLTMHGTGPAEIARIVDRPELPLIQDIYRAIGVEYAAIDVDRLFQSSYFDLNTFAPPNEWLGCFDFVNDEGTLEHLANPINGFQVAHELAKPGGIVRHSAPFLGELDHGFFYATPKLYAHIYGDNGYEFLGAAVQYGAEPWKRFDNLLFKNVPEGLEIPNLWCELIVRKRSHRPFIYPTDHLAGDAAASREQINRNMRAYAAARLRGDAAP